MCRRGGINDASARVQPPRKLSPALSISDGTDQHRPTVLSLTLPPTQLHLCVPARGTREVCTRKCARLVARVESCTGARCGVSHAAAAHGPRCRPRGAAGSRATRRRVPRCPLLCARSIRTPAQSHQPLPGAAGRARYVRSTYALAPARGSGGERGPAAQVEVPSSSRHTTQTREAKGCASWCGIGDTHSVMKVESQYNYSSLPECSGFMVAASTQSKVVLVQTWDCAPRGGRGLTLPSNSSVRSPSPLFEIASLAPSPSPVRHEPCSLTPCPSARRAAQSGLWGRRPRRARRRGPPPSRGRRRRRCP